MMEIMTGLLLMGRFLVAGTKQASKVVNVLNKCSLRSGLRFQLFEACCIGIDRHPIWEFRADCTCWSGTFSMLKWLETSRPAYRGTVARLLPLATRHPGQDEPACPDMVRPGLATAPVASATGLSCVRTTMKCSLSY